MDIKSLAAQYKDELLESVIPFWTRNSPDPLHGGYFSCLDREGTVYDTDKFMWLQGRQLWMYSMLYNKVEKRQQWLDMALTGAPFLDKYGHDDNFDWYFSLTREGQPLVQPYNIFSHIFAAMGFAQLAVATGSDRYAHIAVKTFQRVLAKQNNPKCRWNKSVAGTRDLKGFSLPMILCNMSLEIEPLLGREMIDETIDSCIREVMEVFYREELGLIVENVTPQGQLSDSFEGRVMNPGHALEAMWFIMDLGVRLGKRDLIDKAVEIALRTIDYGWDREHGGIFYFLDRLGKPQVQLEWDQKLWWVHFEAMVCMLKGYQLTSSEQCWKWFLTLHDYTWEHFKDREHPEWFGYLSRRGEVLLPLKGGKWKGCFHVPRGLYQCWQILEKCENREF